MSGHQPHSFNAQTVKWGTIFSTVNINFDLKSLSKLLRWAAVS